MNVDPPDFIGGFFLLKIMEMFHPAILIKTYCYGRNRNKKINRKKEKIQ
jgi:hypothetical protein